MIPPARIADAQALTDNFENPDKVRQNIVEVALDYLSCGLDPAKSTLFIQSQMIDAVSQRFAHLRLAIHTGQPQTRRILRNQRLRLHQYEKDIPEIYNILKRGSEIAREAAAQTLSRVLPVAELGNHRQLPLIRAGLAAQICHILGCDNLIHRIKLHAQGWNCGNP